MTRSHFIIVKHEAKRAGLHYDLRFQMPNSQLWASFAVRKGVPTDPGTKVLAVRTHDHTKEEAWFLGTIETGYGAGKLTKFDDGPCDIIKYTPSHMMIDFKGHKIKGVYHLINVGVAGRNKFKEKMFMLFKGKIPVKETYPDFPSMGMMGRNPPSDTEEVEIPDEKADYQQKKPLKWSITSELENIITDRG
jgi:DNA ligase D-like protein (predicted 3'-phosphoesterase)